MNKKCTVCEKIIERKAYDNDTAWNKRKYCSFACMGKDRTRAEKITCSYCHQPVIVKQRRKCITKRIYCSRKCYSLYRSEIMPREEQNSYGKGIPIEEVKKHKKARMDLNHAVRDGRVKKLPCYQCGDKKSQAHHHDYDKPLDVIWLCFKCHRAEHAKLRIHDNPDLLTQ